VMSRLGSPRTVTRRWFSRTCSLRRVRQLWRGGTPFVRSANDAKLVSFRVGHYEPHVISHDHRLRRESLSSERLDPADLRVEVAAFNVKVEVHAILARLPFGDLLQDEPWLLDAVRRYERPERAEVANTRVPERLTPEGGEHRRVAAVECVREPRCHSV